MPTNDERRKIAETLRSGVRTTDYMSDGAFIDWLFSVVGRSYDWNILDSLADLIEPEPINGATSDGYHTFNELYDHRAKLFSVVVAAFSNNAWKSKRHSDGSMYEGMFIVGIDTPHGQATYHYEIEPYWELFHCSELPKAPEWDGHTPTQAIDRIAGLADLIEPQERTCRVVTEVRALSLTQDMHAKSCSACGYVFGSEVHTQLLPGLGERVAVDPVVIPNYCPNCGAKVIQE